MGIIDYDFIAIVGPTASGKTEVSVALAKLIDGELISCDSRQVYKYLDIGTSKVGEIKKGIRFIDEIPQHLTDIIEPDKIFSAGDFVKMAIPLVNEIKKRKKIPIVVGGTGLYLKALTRGIAPLPARDENLRKKFTNMKKKELFEKLKKVDPISAKKIHPNNLQRIIRALEVHHLTGRPISWWQRNYTRSTIKSIQFGLLWEREELRRRISERIDIMLSRGFLNEVKYVLKLGYPKECPGLQGIGYKEAILYLTGKISYEMMKDRFFHRTWQYAKRQMCWFGSDKSIRWIKLSEPFSAKEIAGVILKSI